MDNERDDRELCAESVAPLTAPHITDPVLCKTFAVRAYGNLCAPYAHTAHFLRTCATFDLRAVKLSSWPVTECAYVWCRCHL